jgi:hypothetical protein
MNATVDTEEASSLPASQLMGPWKASDDGIIVTSLPTGRTYEPNFYAQKG